MDKTSAKATHTYRNHIDGRDAAAISGDTFDAVNPTPAAIGAASRNPGPPMSTMQSRPQIGLSVPARGPACRPRAAGVC